MSFQDGNRGDMCLGIAVKQLQNSIQLRDGVAPFDSINLYGWELKKNLNSRLVCLTK
jgi:hypothetical protein